MTIGEILLTLFAAFVADLLLDSTVHLSRWLTRRAAARLHSDLAARYEEEWLETLSTRPRLVQPLFALDLFRATYLINQNDHEATQVVQRNFRVKRLLDVVVTGCLFLFILPLFVVSALAIKLTSAGPIISKQRRYTLTGKEIELYRFRTMNATVDEFTSMGAKGPAGRFTIVGRVLRRLSIDELPQLINVFQGKLSLVGPRVLSTAHNAQYKELAKGIQFDESILPGITGLAQLDGQAGGHLTTDAEIRNRILYDLDYAEKGSIWLDLKILLATVVAVFRS
jgi:putative colanic acid biosynthesis UDP-glucose lipid carrier transferase